MKDQAFRQQLTDIMSGVRVSMEKLIAFKKIKKSPIVISQNGKIIEVPPEEFSLEDTSQT